jgi:DNA-binding SARP family transcriptional activator/tetratricopeptide (TPR) repeat protein
VRKRPGRVQPRRPPLDAWVAWELVARPPRGGSRANPVESRDVLHAPVAATISIRLLGNFGISRAEIPLAVTAPPKTVPLLSYLLLHREAPLARERLGAIFWPDDLDDEARGKVRRHLYLISKLLPAPDPRTPWLVVTRATVRWNPEAPLDLDVDRFERASASDATLEDAVALYGGDLLDGYYDDFIFALRERLRERYFATLSKLIARWRSGGDYSRALEYLSTLLRADPWREDAVREAMTLRYALGDRAGALAQYETFRARLRAELDVDPMPETTAAYDAVRRNAPARVKGDAIGARGPHTDARSKRALPFVGRDASLERLQRAWDRAARGRGSMLLVGGEAGVGKSRLLAEFAARAEAQGARVIAGTTAAPESQPYQSVVEALRDALPLLASAKLDPLWRTVLAELIPELHPGDPIAAPMLPPERAQARLFEAVARAFHALARERPLIALFEDLHWAGTATLALGEYLARRAPSSPALAIATYREEELARGQPLRDALRRLQRDRACELVLLARLNAEDVATIASSVFGDDARVERAASLYAFSEGNPLFLGEAIRHADSGIGASELARTFDEMVALRLSRLSEGAQFVARAGAISGVGFDVDVLRAATGWAEAQLLEGVDELMEHQLVRESLQSRTDFVFSHQLVQSCVYANVEMSMRRRYHRRIARSLAARVEQHGDDVGAESVAEHYRRAEEPALAAEFYLHAARRAARVYAHERAIDLGTRGLELATDADVCYELHLVREASAARRGNRPLQSADLAALRDSGASQGRPEREAEILRREIEYARAGADVADARALVDRLEHLASAASPTLRSEAALARAGIDIAQGDYEHAVAALNVLYDSPALRDDPSARLRSVALLMQAGREREDLELLALAADRLAREEATSEVQLLRLDLGTRVAFLTRDFEHQIELCRDAIALTERFGDRVAEAEYRHRLALGLGYAGGYDLAAQEYDRAQGLFEECGDRLKLGYLLNNRGTAALQLGRLDEARRIFLDCSKRFSELRVVHAECVAELNLSAVEIWSERGKPALTHAKRAKSLVAEFGSPAIEASIEVNICWAYALLDDWKKADPHGRAALELVNACDERNTPDVVCDYAALVYRFGEHERGGALLDASLALTRKYAASMTAPQSVLFACACRRRREGDRTAAVDYLREAGELYREWLERIPDAESRSAFAALPFNRDLRAALEEDRWPSWSEPAR